MIVDARQLDDGAVIECDVCIAGGGAAGITLALELMGSGRSVCILESAGFNAHQPSQALYEGINTGDSDWGHTGCRARWFGGSTNWWSGFCRHLERHDIEPRSYMEYSGWPIEYDVLTPYYRRAHATCEIGAVEYEAGALAERSGLPLLPVDRSVVDTITYQFSDTRFGPTYRGVLEPAEDVTIYTFANLVNIRLTSDDSSTEAFECRTLDGLSFSVEAEDFVLAMGGLENARVMLASSEQMPNGVGNQNDVVGRYFMEHPHFFGIFLATPPDVNPQLYAARNSMLTVDDVNPDGIEVPVMGALAPPRELLDTDEAPPLAATLVEIGNDDGRTGSLDARVVRSIWDETGTDHRVFRVETRCEQRPLPESRVTLHPSETDALGTPRIVVNWHVADDDMAGYKRGLEYIGAQLASNGVGRLWVPMDTGRISDRISGGCHHIGTCRMGDDPETSVVDADCMVHGSDNLFVAGSAVYPTGGIANPTLTLVALAHRLGDHLRGRS